MEPWTLALFLAAALTIAVTPGPGILYVAARTLAEGRAAGLAGSLGTGVGGLVHVVAGALGVSALVLASAELFTVLKLAGAGYLIWLGWRTYRDAAAPLLPGEPPAAGRWRGFRQGVVVEALNPKTAAFFLAFLPQFIDPAEGVGWRFAVLGCISVFLNTAADVVVVAFATSIRERVISQAALLRRLRRISAAVLCGLGLSLLLARRP